MKILMLTAGTRGDVQPFVALANALGTAGHDVAMCVPLTSQSLVEEHGINASYFDDDMQQLMHNPELRRVLEGKMSLIRLTCRRRRVDSRVSQWDKMAEIGRQGADVVIHTSFTPGNQIAELLRVPSIPVYLQPYPLSFAPPQLPRSLGALLLKTRLHFRKGIIRVLHGNSLSQWRQETLRLPTRRGFGNVLRAPDGSKNRALQAFSRHIVPEYSRKTRTHTTGYWFIPTPQNWQPPHTLSDFIKAGPSPVYIGFGSLAGEDPARTTRVVMTALQKTRTRAVVATGGGGLDPKELTEDTFAVSQVPHDWLFPRMSVIIHAGGAGTTAAALAAGRPQVVCPFSMDQPFWAHRMHQLGVASSPQPQRDLDSDRLAHAIRRAVTDQTMYHRSQWLSKQIRSEDGVASAVKVIESLSPK